MSHRRASRTKTWSKSQKIPRDGESIPETDPNSLCFSCRPSPGGPGVGNKPVHAASMGPKAGGLTDSGIDTSRPSWLRRLEERKRHRLYSPIGGSCIGLQGTPKMLDQTKHFFSKSNERVCVPLCGRKAPPHVIADRLYPVVRDPTEKQQAGSKWGSTQTCQVHPTLRATFGVKERKEGSERVR